MRTPRGKSPELKMAEAVAEMGLDQAITALKLLVSIKKLNGSVISIEKPKEKSDG